MKKIIIIFILMFTLIGCASQSDSSFEDISNVYFIYSSGAGGWRTELNIAGDGTFNGQYTDSDMGDIGDGYPNGTLYYCDFSGKFTSRKEISEFEYSMKCESLVTEKESGIEEIDSDIRYISADPFGMENAGEFRLYLPGMKISDLPQEFLDTAWMYVNEGDETISFYGLYNVGEKTGFVSFPSSD